MGGEQDEKREETKETRLNMNLEMEKVAITPQTAQMDLITPVRTKFHFLTNGEHFRTSSFKANKPNTTRETCFTK